MKLVRNNNIQTTNTTEETKYLIFQRKRTFRTNKHFIVTISDTQFSIELRA